MDFFVIEKLVLVQFTILEALKRQKDACMQCKGETDRNTKRLGFTKTKHWNKVFTPGDTLSFTFWEAHYVTGGTKCSTDVSKKTTPFIKTREN